jgi:hypothetical protein
VSWKDGRRRRDIASGTASTAACSGFELGWDRDEGDPRWGDAKLTPMVTPPGGGDPYEWSGDAWVRVAFAKSVDAGLNLEGHTLAAKVDPTDPQKVAVDWDAVEAAADAA